MKAGKGCSVCSCRFNNRRPRLNQDSRLRQTFVAVNFPVIRDESGERPMPRRRDAGGTDHAPPSWGDHEPAGLNPGLKLAGSQPTAVSTSLENVQQEIVYMDLCAGYYSRSQMKRYFSKNRML